MNMLDYEVLAIILAALALAFLIVYYHYRRHPKMKHYEILPANEMKQKYGLTIENYKPQRFNPKNIPESLRDLIPLAQKWGIDDDIIRDDLQEKASDDEKEALKSALGGRIKDIDEWLDIFGVGLKTDEAAAFMYMLLGLDEIGIRVDPGLDSGPPNTSPQTR